MKKVECQSQKKFSRNFYNVLTGIILIFFALFIFVIFTIWIIIIKFESIETDNPLILFLIKDKHYCLAIPIIVPLSFIFFYLRWTAFNYFKYC